MEINDDTCGTSKTKSQTNFKTLSLCSSGVAYILVKGTVTVPDTGTAAS